jgi:hypothetical protein
MKKLLVLIAATVLFSCNRTGELPHDSRIELPGDVELVSPERDIEARKKPHPVKPDQPPQPPVSITKKAVWLLDFDGYNVVDGIWGAVNCSGSDFDAAQIADIVSNVKAIWWQHDVEITTDEAVYNTYPIEKRIRVVVTRTNFYGNVGGVAYINSLLWYETEKQCFVFCDLLQRNTKFNADAIAHEMGHTAGCWHHRDITYTEFGCTINSEYLFGNHVMGNPYYFSNPILTSGWRTCWDMTDDNQIINNSIN